MNITTYKILLAMTSVLCIYFAILNFNPKHPIEHRFSLFNEDIGVDNIYLLDTGDYIYIPDVFYFTNYSDKQINKIQFTIKSGDKTIYSLHSLLFLDPGEKHQPELSKIEKVKLKGDLIRNKEITSEVKYWYDFNDEPEILTEEFELVEIVK